MPFEKKRRKKKHGMDEEEGKRKTADKTRIYPLCSVQKGVDNRRECDKKKRFHKFVMVALGGGAWSITPHARGSR
jgi:hypothetical protein